MDVSLMPLSRTRRTEWEYDLSNNMRRHLKKIALHAQDRPLLYEGDTLADHLDARGVRFRAMERAIERPGDIDIEYAIRGAQDTLGYAGIWSGWVGVLGCYVAPPMVKVAFLNPQYASIEPQATSLLDERLRELALEQEAFKRSQKPIPKSS